MDSDSVVYDDNQQQNAWLVFLRLFMLNHHNNISHLINVSAPLRQLENHQLLQILLESLKANAGQYSL